MTTDARAVGVDIGGSKIVAVAVGPAGEVLDREDRVTPGRTTDASVVEAVITDAVKTLMARCRVIAVGIGAAGFVERTQQRVMFAPHLSWRDEPLAERLRQRLGLPVLVENDANAALWAEHRFGAARDARDVAMITLGTGIGGALLIGGKVYRGRNGMAGEFGHMQVVPNGRPCECGGTGCWEQYCSGKALARYASEADSPLSGPALTEAARSGDAVALGAYSQIGRWLGTGVANVVAALDPELVVIGGGVSSAGELLLEPARRTLEGVLVGKGFRETPRLVVADLGPLAGAIGAADLARLGATEKPD
jgi:glucokinase